MVNKVFTAYLLLLFLFTLNHLINATKSDSLFQILDETVYKRKYFLKKKEDRLAQLKKDLAKTISLEERYQYSQRIAFEYSYYINDSAIAYSRKSVQLAQKLNNSDHIISSQLDQAYYLCFSGLFHESYKILDSIEVSVLSKNLQRKYFKTAILVYHNQIYQLNISPYAEIYKTQLFNHITSYLEIGDIGSIEYMSILAYDFYVREKYVEAAYVVNQILKRNDVPPYTRAETLFNLGGLYLKAGVEYHEEAKIALIKDAILYNQLAITRNSPLLNLAILIVNEKKNIERANKYIDLAVEDTRIFSSNHKVGIAEKMHNTIKHYYYARVDKQKNTLHRFIAILFLACIFIIITILVLFFNNRILIRTRKKLSETNDELRDSNRIKETYISYFLHQYSIHIDKMTEYKKQILRKLNSGHPYDVIKKEVSESVNTKKDLNEFFLAFDRSVLELYPSFVKEVNALLKRNCQYTVKYNQDHHLPTLNTELRILALLRLGFGDNKEIARIFRFTVQTVYNYRSKAKARAINEDTFEDDIKNTCN